MAIISTFLCWSNTRTGSAVCGYYTLVIAVVCLAFYMLRYIALDEMRDSIELKGIVYAGFVQYSFLIGVSLILLPGVYMDRKYLLLPWIYVLVITVLYETGAIALITTVHLEQNHTLDVWEIVAVAFYCVRLFANCYSFACVVSQYQELSEGRGTYEFLFKPHRHQMARSALMSDLEEYNPPYGASLPPYSEENPYKEYSPPDYENLTSEFEGRSFFLGSCGGHLPVRSNRICNVASSCPTRANVNRPCSDLDTDHETYNEGDCTYNAADTRIYYLNGSTEDIVEHSRRFSASEGTGQRCPHSASSHQRCGRFGDQHSNRNCFHESGIAMTSSSASLLDTSSQQFSQSQKFQKAAQPKQIPVSPLTIQKRTYITWI